MSQQHGVNTPVTLEEKRNSEGGDRGRHIKKCAYTIIWRRPTSPTDRMIRRSHQLNPCGDPNCIGYQRQQITEERRPLSSHNDSNSDAAKLQPSSRKRVHSERPQVIQIDVGDEESGNEENTPPSSNGVPYPVTREEKSKRGKRGRPVEKYVHATICRRTISPTDRSIHRYHLLNPCGDPRCIGYQRQQIIDEGNPLSYYNISDSEAAKLKPSRRRTMIYDWPQLAENSAPPSIVQASTDSNSPPPTVITLDDDTDDENEPCTPPQRRRLQLAVKSARRPDRTS